MYIVTENFAHTLWLHRLQTPGLKSFLTRNVPYVVFFSGISSLRYTLWQVSYIKYHFIVCTFPSLLLFSRPFLDIFWPPPSVNSCLFFTWKEGWACLLIGTVFGCFCPPHKSAKVGICLVAMAKLLSIIWKVADSAVMRSPFVSERGEFSCRKW